MIVPGAARWKVVAQQYVERPLLARGRKFDVRQWILITRIDKEPPRVYGFSACYARVAATPWSRTNLDDSLAHLCNYAVQKHAPPEKSTHDVDAITDGLAPFRGWMWSDGELAAFVDARREPGTFDRVVRPQVRRIAVAVARVARAAGVTRRARGFEWLGLDVILDEDLRCWLLEVNVSPDVSHSTPVTADLVPRATADALALVLDDDDAAAWGSSEKTAGLVPPRAATADDDKPRWELWSSDDDDDSGGQQRRRSSSSDGSNGDSGRSDAFAAYTAETAPADAIDALWNDLTARYFPPQQQPPGAVAETPRPQIQDDSDDEL